MPGGQGVWDRDFPLDPRILSNVIATVMMGDIGSLDARAYADTAVASRLTKISHFRRFIGRLDEPEMVWDNSGRLVTLPFRDYSGIFLDTIWGTEEIDTSPGVTLQQVVHQIFHSVIKSPSDLPEPVFTDPTTPALQVGAVTGKSLFVTENEDKAWDVLTRILDLFGLVPTFVLDTLYIRTPTTKGIPTSRFVYGHNVERISLRRDMRRQAAKRVKLVIYDPAAGKALSAFWPPDSDADFKLVSKTTGTKKQTTTIQEVQYNLPPGTMTPNQLLAAAHTVYLECAEREVQGELQTRELVDSSSLELMGLKNGDILLVTLAPSELGLIDGLSEQEAVEALSDPARADPMDPGVATVLVRNLAAVQALETRFYITEATHTWHRDDGYQLTIKFRDFLQ